MVLGLKVPFLFILIFACSLVGTLFTNNSKSYIHTCFEENVGYIQIKTVRMYSDSLANDPSIFLSLPKIEESDRHYLDNLEGINYISYESRIQGILYINRTSYDYYIDNILYFNILDILIVENYDSFFKYSDDYKIDKQSIMNVNSIYICGSFEFEDLQLGQNITLSINHIKNNLIISGLCYAPHEEQMIIISREVMLSYNIDIIGIYNAAWLKCNNVNSIKDIMNVIKNNYPVWSVFYDGDTIHGYVLWSSWEKYDFIIISLFLVLNTYLLIKDKSNYVRLINNNRKLFIVTIIFILIINLIIVLENFQLIRIKMPFSRLYITKDFNLNTYNFVEQLISSQIILNSFLALFYNLNQNYKMTK